MKHKKETVVTLYARGVQKATKAELERLAKKYGWSVGKIVDEALGALKRELRNK